MVRAGNRHRAMLRSGSAHWKHCKELGYIHWSNSNDCCNTYLSFSPASEHRISEHSGRCCNPAHSTNRDISRDLPLPSYAVPRRLTGWLGDGRKVCVTIARNESSLISGLNSHEGTRRCAGNPPRSRSARAKASVPKLGNSNAISANLLLHSILPWTIAFA